MDEDENPCLIFDAEDGDGLQTTSQIPLILIHDGGGTCFSYHCLSPLGRPTYEIHNPRYYTQQPWTGGIPEMAQHYAGLIKTSTTIPRGRILLGGWSFGGVLSLAIARVLADDDDYAVLGIVMVDSVCPGSVRAEDWGRGAGHVTFPGQFSAMTSEDTKQRVRWCFADSAKAILQYQMPSWDGYWEPGTGADADGGSRGEDQLSRAASPSRRCPPVILLRAMEVVPVDSGHPSRVDLVRDDRSLGWNKYRDGFFQEIVDVPGHHFSIFAFHNIGHITENLVEACNKFEAWARQGPAPS